MKNAQRSPNTKSLWCIHHDYFSKKKEPTSFSFIYSSRSLLCVCVIWREQQRNVVFSFVPDVFCFPQDLHDRNKKCWLADEYQMERGRWLKFSYWIFSLMPLAFFVHRFIAPCRTPPNLIARLLAFPDDTLTMQKSKILFFFSFVCVGVTAWHWSLDQPDPTDQFLPEFRLLSPVFHAEFFVSSCALLGFILRVA